MVYQTIEIASHAQQQQRHKAQQAQAQHHSTKAASDETKEPDIPIMFRKKKPPPNQHSILKKAPVTSSIPPSHGIRKKAPPPSSHRRRTGHVSWSFSPSAEPVKRTEKSAYEPVPLKLKRNLDFRALPSKRSSYGMMCESHSSNNRFRSGDDLLLDDVDPEIEQFMRMPFKRSCTETSIEFMRSGTSINSAASTLCANVIAYDQTRKQVLQPPPTSTAGNISPPPLRTYGDLRVKGELYPRHSLSLLK